MTLHPEEYSVGEGKQFPAGELWFEPNKTPATKFDIRVRGIPRVSRVLPAPFYSTRGWNVRSVGFLVIERNV